MIDTWEYYTTFISADIDRPGARDFLNKSWPEWKNAPRFAVQAMMPELNAIGAEGWELVHMQPVAEVGASGDVRSLGTYYLWSHTYFCVSKRRKRTDSLSGVSETKDKSGAP